MQKYTYYSLTQPQKRIWYTQMLYPESSMFNIGGTVHIGGYIDTDILKRAIYKFVNSNSTFQLRFTQIDGKPRQYFIEDSCIDIETVDFSIYSDSETEFKLWYSKKAKEIFVMEESPLYYFCVFKLGTKDYGYFIKLHHIIADGWSIQILTDKIIEYYNAISNNQDIEVMTDFTYKDVIETEREFLNSEKYEKYKKFWMEKFKVLPIGLPQINNQMDIDGNRKTYYFSNTETEQIKSFCENNKISINIFFITLYLLIMNKTTGDEDLVIGTPILGRYNRKEKDIFGMFVSSIPYRFVIDDSEGIFEMMNRVMYEFKNCFTNQRYPYNKLVSDLNLAGLGVSGLYRHCINYYNTKIKSSLNHISIKNTEFYNGQQEYDFQMIIRNWSDDNLLQIDFDYKLSKYTDVEMDALFHQLKVLIQKINANKNVKIKQIDLLSEKEKEILIHRFNMTDAIYPKDKSVIRLFEEQAVKMPDRIAVSDSREITYRELYQMVCSLYGVLKAKGVKRHSIVGIIAGHSIETIVSILAVLKAGAAYIPIDPNNPLERVKKILKDASVYIVLTDETDMAKRLPAEILDLKNQSMYKKTVDNVEEVQIKPDDLAYILYTSGSTGEPKGIMVEHRGLTNYIYWAAKHYIKNEKEVFPLFTSLSFDLTITSIFTPLISGGRIVIYNDKKDEEYVLYRIMRENKVTVMKLTPTHLSLIKDFDNNSSSIRTLIVGGEQLSRQTAIDVFNSFGGKTEIYNEYGPTETVVGCMIHRFEPNKDADVAVPIGHPADNVNIYILDHNLNPVPVGCIGEIYISGDGVAKGYLNNKELTVSKFLNNPFHPDKRMYKTDDLGKFIDNNTILYCGRRDNQVKIRGNRIEIEEVKNCLLKYPHIKDSIVICANNDKKEVYLCAYYIKSIGFEESQLRGFLEERLPEYMIPHIFIEINVIPLTNNGKIDYKKLPLPEYKRKHPSAVINNNDREAILTRVIGEVLDIQDVQKEENFYHLGGDSIKAIQITSKLNQKGYKLSVKDILTNPVIRNMALELKFKNTVTGNNEICEGNIPNTPIISYFLKNKFANHNYYTQSILLKLKKNVDISKFESVFRKLINLHDTLRVNYDSNTGTLFYNKNHLNQKISVPYYDMKEYGEEEQLIKMEQISTSIKSDFDIENGLLMKACFFQLAEEQIFLFLTAHHLVVDGVSWGIIVEFLCECLRLSEFEVQEKQFIKTSSFQDWALLVSKLDSVQYDTALEPYSIIQKKAGLDSSCNQFYYYSESEVVEINLSKEQTQEMLAIINDNRKISISDVLLSALAVTLDEILDIQRVFIDMEWHGREDVNHSVDITNTVGWFTSIAPLYLTNKNDDMLDLIKEVKEQIRKSKDYCKNYGFMYFYHREQMNTKSFIKFNYMGDYSKVFDNEFFEYSYINTGYDVGRENYMWSPVEINGMIVNNSLSLQFIFNKNRVDIKTMKAFSDNFKQQIHRITDYLKTTDYIFFTPSDFETADVTGDELDSLFE